MTGRAVMLFVAALVWCASSGGSPTPQERPAESGWKKYSVLAERNIFSRDRGRREPAQTAGPKIPRQTRPTIVLTGVVKRGGVFTAFLEDVVTNETRKVQVGEAVDEGKVMKIEVDHIDYEKGGKTTKVELGADLGGDGLSSTTEAAASGAAAGGKSVTRPTGDESAILKRLRERRQRELGGK